jgi:hypothetical protein
MIKTNLQETERQGVDWIQLAHVGSSDGILKTR